MASGESVVGSGDGADAAEYEAAVSNFPIPVIDIDEEGTYKYVLLKIVDGPPNIKTVKTGMYVVRGHAWADYHDDLVQEFDSSLAERGLKHQRDVSGGGRIAFNKGRKHISIYGYSVGYGRANHTITCQLLKRHYKDYTVEWSNSGY